MSDQPAAIGYAAQLFHGLNNEPVHCLNLPTPLQGNEVCQRIVAQLGIPTQLIGMENGSSFASVFLHAEALRHRIRGVRRATELRLWEAIDAELRQCWERLVQYRFPKSKKRRIRSKWAKDPRNYRTETRVPRILFDGGSHA